MKSSLSFFLTTTGRPTFTRMLNSLIHQLREQDTLYVFVDGKEYWKEIDKQISKFLNITKNTKNIKIKYEKDNLGYWGHGLRNKYQSSLDGDYILHCDDDDIYVKDAIKKITQFSLDQEHIFLFKFYTDFVKNISVWKFPTIAYRNIGTPSGVIPNIPSKFGYWDHKYGGDFNFYISCKFKYQFIDEIIYITNPIKKYDTNKYNHS